MSVFCMERATEFWLWASLQVGIDRLDACHEKLPSGNQLGGWSRVWEIGRKDKRSPPRGCGDRLHPDDKSKLWKG